MRAGEHGPDELYDKFHVYKTKSLIQLDLESKKFSSELNAFDKSDRLGANGEFVFVLRPETNDKAAIEALYRYARVCEHSYPELSAQIVERLTKLLDTISDLMMDMPEEDAYRELKKLRDNGTRY